MRERRPHLVLVTLLGALSAACERDAVAPLAQGDFLRDFGAAACAFYVACGIVPDAAACDASLAGSLDNLGRLVTLAKAGRIAYHADEGRRCIDAVAAVQAGCSRALLLANGEYTRACTAAFEGLIPDGATCTISAECRSGVCLPTDAQCDRGTACCADTCAPGRTRVALGGDCSSPTTTVCAAGTFCKLDPTTGASTCQPQLGAGDACPTTSACRSGLLCYLDRCVAQPAEDQDCTSAPCDRFDDYCDPTTFRCTRAKPVGGTCGMDAACVGHAYCDVLASTCKPRPRLGEPCGSDGCIAGLDCTSGGCVTPRPLPTCL